MNTGTKTNRINLHEFVYSYSQSKSLNVVLCLLLMNRGK